MDRTEVTVRAFAECVAAGVCRPPANSERSRPYEGDEAPSDRSRWCNARWPLRTDHPVNCVNWNQAVAYCRWRGARLPTESEWVFAALGPGRQAYPWGSAEPNARRACLYHRGGTCPVGAYPRSASPFGLLDMVGNVFEFTSTAERIYGQVVRGRSWADDILPLGSRHWDVAYMERDGRGASVGFRCARDAP